MTAVEWIAIGTGFLTLFVAIVAIGLVLLQRIDVAAQRISDVEREQARQEGVNSVLRQQTHTHESLTT